MQAIHVHVILHQPVYSVCTHNDDNSFASRMLSHHVICSLCSEPFGDPRILPCLHSFCFRCLCTDVHESEPRQHIQCPMCLRNAPVPLEGVAALPRNLHLAFEVEVAGYVSKMTSPSEVSCNFCANACTDAAIAFCGMCCKFLCKGGLECHSRVPQLSSHKVLDLDQESAVLLPKLLKPTAPNCSQCDQVNAMMNFYCQTCSLSACPLCVIAFHKDHNVAKLSTIADTQRDEMKKSLQHAQETVAMLDRAIDANHMMMQQVVTSRQEAELALEKAFKELLDTLEERKKELLLELETITLSVTMSLTAQKEQLEKIREEIRCYTDITCRVLQTHADHEVVALRDLLPAELEAILTMVENISLSPSQHCFLTSFVQTNPLVNELRKFGDVVNLLPAPQESTFTLPSTVRASLKCCVKVETKTPQGMRYPHGGLHLKAELQSTSHNGPVIPGRIEDHGDGIYTVTLIPCYIGLHQLRITMEGQHVQRSPYDLEMRCNYTTLLSAQQAISVDAKPLCTAIHDNGDIYVGCLDDLIRIFDQSGCLKSVIGSSGTGSGQFKCPSGISIKGDVMYIADFRNHRIQKLTVVGDFLCAFGEKGSGPGQFNGPRSVITADSKDRLVVLDKGNHRVQILSQEGDWLLTLDDNDLSGSGAFRDPWGIALDFHDHLHVSTCDSNSIKVFTLEGAQVRTYGIVKGPRGVAVNEEGYSFVSEFDGDSLAIFDPEGNKIHTVGDLNKPYGATISHTGNLYIPNFGGCNVLKYNM